MRAGRTILLTAGSVVFLLAAAAGCAPAAAPARPLAFPPGASAPQRAGSAVDTVEIGTRLRVKATAPGHPRRMVRGALQRLDSENLVLLVGRRTVFIPLEQIESVERSTGVGPSTRTGALFGLMMGGGVGVIAGFGADPHLDCNGQASEGSCFFVPLLAGVALGGIGMAVGALVGSFSSSDRWEDVGLGDLRVGATLTPGRDVGVSARWSLPVRHR